MEIAIELDNYKTNDTLEEDLVGILVDRAEVIAALTLKSSYKELEYSLRSAFYVDGNYGTQLLAYSVIFDILADNLNLVRWLIQ